MKRPFVVILVLLVLIASLGGCSGQSSGSLTATATISQPTSSARTISLNDDGQTITLHVGETILLQLGEAYDWSVTVADQTVFSRVVNILVVRGAQGVYRADKVGTTTLTAAGDPACRKTRPPCAMPSREFRVQIVVQ